MRTFLQLQEDLITQLKESSTDPNYWSRQEIKDALNDTCIFIADETHCFKLRFIIEVKAGMRLYKLPENYIFGSLHRVEFDEEVIYPTTSAELDVHSSSWKSESGRPRNYLQDICESDEIVVYPKPDTDGPAYNLADDSGSGDYGTITTVGDTSHEEFNSEEGVIVDESTGEAHFDETEGTGPVVDIRTAEDNLQIFAAKYPKRLFNNTEVFLHPVSNKPRKILTLGSMAILLSKEGEGKDIQKASYYNKRFMEACNMFKRPQIKRMHKMRSITDGSHGNYNERGDLNLGNNYPSYFVR